MKRDGCLGGWPIRRTGYPRVHAVGGKNMERRGAGR